ncbi:MAG: TerC family protein [Myxococcota bacterium]
MIDLLTSPEVWVALVSLTAMEIVLGIDNIVFISILTEKLPKNQQGKGRRLGLALALVMRLGLLGALSWVMRFTAPLFAVLGRSLSGRDLILLGGGLFLIAKSTHEIYEKVEVGPEENVPEPRVASFRWVLLQIVALDVVFSLDSVITAVGMAQHLAVMVSAMVGAVVVMLIFANAIGDFVSRHPSMKVLALSFLLLIGVMLVAEGMGVHVGKGYIYSAMAFSLVVEILNLRLRKAHMGRAAAR